jgi:hypothetical protein
MNYIEKTFSQTLTVIKNHKLLFLILAIAQILAITLFAVVTAKYQLVILDDLNGVLQPMQDANYDVEKIESGQPMIENMLPILQSYKKLKADAKEFMMIVIGFSLIINGFIWIATYAFFFKLNFLDVIKMWLKYILVAIVGIFFLSVISSFFLKEVVTSQVISENISGTAVKIGIVSFIIYYFMLVGFTNLHEHDWKIFVSMIKKTILNVKLVVPLVVLNFGLLLLVSYGIYRNTLNEQFYNNVIILGVVGIILLVITRIFLIAGVKNIIQK